MLHILNNKFLFTKNIFNIVNPDFPWSRNLVRESRLGMGLNLGNYTGIEMGFEPLSRLKTLI